MNMPGNNNEYNSLLFPGIILIIVSWHIHFKLIVNAPYARMLLCQLVARFKKKKKKNLFQGSHAALVNALVILLLLDSFLMP